MKQTKQQIFSKLLIGGGSLLLIIGGFLAYPYVNSRLATFPSAMQASPTATLPPTTAPTATPTCAPTATGTPDPTATPTPSPTPTITPVPTKPPTPPERIVIPDIGVDAPVVPVSVDKVTIGGQEQSTWQAPDMYAAGWHESSAKLGERDNLVLNGHNTTNGEVFRDLYTLKTGAVITLYSDVITQTYAVAESLVLKEAGQPLEVRLKNARYIGPTAEEQLTLVTCHPYGSLRNRLIVIAFPIDD